MSNHSLTAIHQRAVSAPVPPANVSRRSSRSAEEALFDETFQLRRRAVYMKARAVPDAAAEVDVSVWAAIRAGERSTDRLWDVARAAAVRQRRWEHRQRRNDALGLDPSDPSVTRQFGDDVEAVVARRRDAAQAITRVSAAGFPASDDALLWASRVAGVCSGGPLPSRVKMAGQRWFARVRAELAVSDAA